MSEERATPAWAVGRGVETDMSGDSAGNLGGAFLRFWLKKAEEKTVIFLTDGGESLTVWEHEVQLAGKWGNYFTCLATMGMACPLCGWADAHADKKGKGQFARYKVQMFTIIDTSKYTNAETGKVYENQKKLYCAKNGTMEILKRKYLTQIEADRKLKFAKYKIFRSNTDTSPRVGTDFEYITHVDPVVLPDAAELDYEKLLAPNPSAMKDCVLRLKASGGGPVEETKKSGVVEGTDTRVEF